MNCIPIFPSISIDYIYVWVTCSYELVKMLHMTTLNVGTRNATQGASRHTFVLVGIVKQLLSLPLVLFCTPELSYRDPKMDYLLTSFIIYIIIIIIS